MGRSVVPAWALASAAVLLLFGWQGHQGFNLWDEGFLWYGVRRTLQGEVPIRDFMAYDPGRYYWTAALARLQGGDGIMQVRIAVAFVHVMGLFAGLLLVARSTVGPDKGRIAYLLLATATLVVWMYPRHKLFDISLSMFQIGLLAFLAAHPTRRRLFVCGVCVGLAAVFGRNHGVYGALGSLGLIAWLAIGRAEGPGFLKSALLWGAGLTTGFLPILGMALLVPGFAAAFWASITFLFEHQATNLPLPVPWPWKVDMAAGSIGETARGLLVGLFFVGTLVFGVSALGWVTLRRLRRQPVSPTLAAAAFLALPYAHHAFSRADVGHLAQGVFPLLVGLLVLVAGLRGYLRWPLAAGLCAASLWVMHAFHPGWQCLSSRLCTAVEISGSTLQLDPGTAHDVALLRRLAAQHAGEGRSFAAVPFWPGAYALLERRSPLWEIYALFPRSAAFEEREIARLRDAAPGFVLVLDLALDGREELRFRNTHPRLHQYIIEHFDRQPDAPGPPYLLYTTRPAAP